MFDQQSPWGNMQQGQDLSQMQQIPQLPGQQMQGAIMPQQMQAPQMTVYDYPGVKEALGIPLPQVPPTPPQGQVLQQTEQQQQNMASPWNSLMEQGYGTYL